MKTLHGHTVLAKDGDIGKVHDFYFHDDTWVIRYLVVDTGHWLPGRKVLVRAGVLGKPGSPGSPFPVALTRDQVRRSPEIDTDKPVSRQQELDLHRHYGWPLYWVDPGSGAWPEVSPMRPVFPAPTPAEIAAEGKVDPRLRSIREVTGYHIHASDGELGHVEDFIVEDAPWVIRYFVVRTSDWLPGRKVLISTQWLGQIHHRDRRVIVRLTRENIRHSPEFHHGQLVNREYEERLHDHYQQPRYWEKGSENSPGKQKDSHETP